jgi:hypothetical protein
MEKTMKRFTPLIFVVLLSRPDYSAAQTNVESRGDGQFTKNT